jgi:hypothetical protein
MRCWSGALAAQPVFAALFSLTPVLAVSNPHPDAAQTQASAQVYPFDGIWEGTILFDKEALLAATSTPAAGVPMRVEIHDSVVRVFMNDGEGFSEVKPGLFHIAPVSANAVIYATESAQGGPWVESWVFVVTQKDDHTLIVEYARLVNNVGTPLSDPSSKFGTRGAGEFQRVSTPQN